MKAVVCFSGGQDSTGCLYWARGQFQRVCALSFDYGQRHRAELDAASRIAAMAQVEHRVLNVPAFSQSGGNALVDSAIPVRETSSLPSTFVPGRNIVFGTLAAGLATVLWPGEPVHIVLGVCEADFSGYPDCREDTMLSLRRTLSLGLGTTVHIHTPLMHMDKAASVVWAAGMPGCMEALALSVTCYHGQRPGCGGCPACKLRARGFATAGHQDPAEVGYAP
jgi:7-cyano-7-deazaguanine synthase